MREKYDLKIIEENLKIFGHLEAGGITEVRIFPKDRYLVLNGRREYVGATVSGYYNDYAQLAKDVEPFNEMASIYFTLNPCKQELIHRSMNRLQMSVTTTTSDNDILCDLWFPIDLDPVCPVTGISSSDAELSSAIKKQGEIISFFASQGIMPVGAESGNGCHLLIRMIAYPNTDETKTAKQGLMQSLSDKFSDDSVKVDAGNHNMSRIWKLYGTHACKGDPSEERPHRISKLHIPSEIPPPVDLYELLKELQPLKQSITPTKTKTASPKKSDVVYAAFNVESYLSAWGGEWRKQEKGDVTWFQFAECPVHTDPDGHQWECGICQDASGKMGAKCMHNDSYVWLDFKAVLGDIQPFLDKPIFQSKPKDSAVSEQSDEDRKTTSHTDRSVSKANSDNDYDNDNNDTELSPIIKVFPVFPEIAWRGIFSDFRSAHSHTTEAPDEFLFASILTAAGALFGRKGWMWYARKLYPNFYTCVVGVTARSRKTTASEKAIDLLQRCDPSVLYYRGLASAEGFINLFSALYESEEEAIDELITSGNLVFDEAPAKYRAHRSRLQEGVSSYEGIRLLCYLSEFSALLKKAQKESSAGLTEAIIDAYDNPDKLDNPTRTSPLTASNPSCSIIASTTTGRLLRSLTKEETEGGFTNRFTYFIGNRKAPNDDPPEPDMEYLNKAVYGLVSARQQWGDTQFQMLSSTRQLWKRYYDEWYYQNENDVIDPITGRLPDQVRKLALQYAMIENNVPEILPEQMEAAIVVGRYWHECICTLFKTYGLSETQQMEQEVLEAVSNGGKSKTELYDYFSKHIDARSLNTALDSLQKIGRIIQQKQKNKRGKPTTVFRLFENMSDS